MTHDRLERLAALKREGILTDAEYEAKRAALIDGAVAGAPVLASSGRNTGHVIQGFLFGVPFGLVAVAFLLFMPRGRKREDALFGAWLGTVVGVMTVAVTAAALATTAGGGESRAQANDVPVCLRTPAAYIPAGGISCAPWLTPTPAAVARTAPEIMAAVRAIQPTFCVQPPDGDLNGIRKTSLYTLTGPTQQPDGSWLVNCRMAGTLWFGSAGSMTSVAFKCQVVDPTSLTVTNVDKGHEVTSSEKGVSITFGRSCLD